jgi:hypothetical protein
MMPNHYNTRSSKLNAVANGTAPLGGTSTPSTQPSPVPNPYKVPRNSATPPEVAVGATDPGTDVCTPPRTNSRNGVELSNLLPIPIVTPAVASPASALTALYTYQQKEKKRNLAVVLVILLVMNLLMVLLQA